MSQLGQSRRFWPARATSALPPIATEQPTSPEVRKVPQGDIALLFGHLAGAPYSGAYPNASFL